MIGLCHKCFSSNNTLTIIDGMPYCEKCADREFVVHDKVSC